jgi:hypothetical protein
VTSPLPADVQQSSVRVVGSNYTTFQYAGKTIAYLEEVNDGGQPALSQNGQGYEVIHPLGYITPTDIVTSRALDAGVLELSIRELWHQEIWEQLPDLAGAKDIVQIFQRLAQKPQYVTCVKIVTPPTGPRYGKIYHRCVIVNIADGDSVSIGMLSVAKRIRVAYTHTTPLL